MNNLNIGLTYNLVRSQSNVQ